MNKYLKTGLKVAAAAAVGYVVYKLSLGVLTPEEVEEITETVAEATGETVEE